MNPYFQPINKHNKTKHSNMNTIVAAITVKKDNTNLQTANSINTNTIVEKKNRMKSLGRRSVETLKKPIREWNRCNMHVSY